MIRGQECLRDQPGLHECLEPGSGEPTGPKQDTQLPSPRGRCGRTLFSSLHVAGSATRRHWISRLVAYSKFPGQIPLVGPVVS